MCSFKWNGMPGEKKRKTTRRRALNRVAPIDPVNESAGKISRKEWRSPRSGNESRWPGNIGGATSKRESRAIRFSCPPCSLEKPSEGGPPPRLFASSFFSPLFGAGRSPGYRRAAFNIEYNDHLAAVCARQSSACASLLLTLLYSCYHYRCYSRSREIFLLSREMLKCCKCCPRNLKILYKGKEAFGLFLFNKNKRKATDQVAPFSFYRFVFISKCFPNFCERCM